MMTMVVIVMILIMVMLVVMVLVVMLLQVQLDEQSGELEMISEKYEEQLSVSL